MKYIRAKGGNIYETKDLIKCEDNRYPNGWFTKNDVPLTAIKESDNVEDLLDEFVVIGIKESHIERSIYNEFDKELFANLNCKANGFEIYGATWTYIGLIYTAKLTEKGWKLL